MTFRTDLAVERREMAGGRIPDGVFFEEFTDGEIKTTKIEITNENGEKALGKPMGKYVTVEFANGVEETDYEDERIITLKQSLKEMIGQTGLVLVAGLGNENITPDALGPQTVNRIFATRHITEKSEKLGFPSLRQVAAISTGVLGQTGMETVEILKSVCDTIKPSAVIVIDALATGSAGRLGKTVQISDTGICPGSGVGNSRKRIDEKTLGSRVISIGVPTVIDASTLCGEDKEGTAEMMVTPRDIDKIIITMSKLLSAAINLALQKNLAFKDLISLA